MARVNDGNLLQHFTECALVAKLTAEGESLRLVATHAMAPHEPAENPEVHDFNRRARAKLAAASKDSDVAVLRAYALTFASTERYPNSAALFAALLGAPRLAGVLCEIRPEARFALEESWRDTDVAIEGRDWREAHADGVLFPPEGLDRPWLITLDPYTWLHDGEAKKEQRGPYLMRPDVELLRHVLAGHVRTGQPGALSAFVYGVDPSHAKAFRSHMLKLADRLGLERAVLGVGGPDGTRHLGIVMTTVPDLAAEAAEGWDRFLSEAEAPGDVDPAPLD